MKNLILRTAALSLAALLAACGGPVTDDTSPAGVAVQTGVPTTTVTATTGVTSVSAAATASTAAATVTVTTVAANSPAPDCAADGCSSPRIIDANAEAWRYDAMRRAALDGGNPQS